MRVSDEIAAQMCRLARGMELARDGEVIYLKPSIRILAALFGLSKNATWKIVTGRTLHGRRPKKKVQFVPRRVAKRRCPGCGADITLDPCVTCAARAAIGNV